MHVFRGDCSSPVESEEEGKELKRDSKAAVIATAAAAAAVCIIHSDPHPAMI